MSEGLLDINVPMNYFRETQYPQSYRDWCNNMITWKAGRHVVNGPGIYLNTITDSMTQINYSSNLAGMDGTNPYVYHQTDNDGGTPNSAFWTAAKAQTHYALRREVPAAEWITTPTQGIIRGTVLDRDSQVMDGATVTLTDGPTSATVKTDGTGFFAFLKVDPDASYTVTASYSGLPDETATCSVTAGVVTTVDFTMVPVTVSRFRIE
jgi:hypothetical protein